MSVVTIFATSLFILAALASAWVALMAAWGTRRTHSSGSEDGPLLRLAVLIPAHDEESEIAVAVRSISRSRYPVDRFDVFVLADNCQDETAQRARESGATVWERREPTRRGKGYALNALIENLRALPGYDGWVFFDADSRVHPDCLRALGAALARGERAVQGFYGSRSGQGPWGGVAVLASRLFNGARPAGRARLGLSAGLRGNAMAFRPEIFDRHRWSDGALLEDWELALDLAQSGERVTFCREARVWARPAPSRRAAVEQRRRWEGARPRLIAQRWLTLVVHGLLGRNALALESALDLIIPPVTCLAGIGMLGLTVGGLTGDGVQLAAGIVTLASLSIAVAFADRFERPTVLARSLGSLPGFIAWKLGLYGGIGARSVLSSHRRADSDWVRTERPSERTDSSRRLAGAGREDS